MQPTNHWHVFCKVIDNFGDIGVCWRLAQQLTQSQQKQVTLWVDDLDSFKAICPEINPQLALQKIQNVSVGWWQEPFQQAQVLTQADVVIEAFACELPEAVLTVMKASKPQPVWLNLEYLSAEDWVEDFHAKPSPVHGMMKYFFFPGFTQRTGGLLWQAELLDLPRLMHSTEAKQGLLNELGVSLELTQADLLISLFAYENPQVIGLLEALYQADAKTHLLVPQGRISTEVSQWLQQPLIAGKSITKGNVTIAALPFMAQSTYDRLLAACDINFVRGEESFVRAQMLGLPMLWHIYQQEDDAHLVKLEAYLARYLAKAPAALATELQAAFLAWNQPQADTPDWLTLLNTVAEWKHHAENWQQQQKSFGDLTTNLVKYVENTL